MNQILSAESIGLLSIALLMIGFAKFILYYKSFNIPIIEYIETSEIITLFADNIAIAICVSLFSALPYYFVITPYLSTNIDNHNITSILYYFLDKSFPLLIIASVIVFSIIILFFKRTKIYTFELISYIALIPLLAIFLPAIILMIFINLEINSKTDSLLITSMIINFCIVILLSTINEIKKVKHFRYYNQIIVEFENETLTSDDDFYFIGKTKSHVFFYCLSKNSSIAYNTSKLKSIQYKFSK
ncbi:hypothetical protein ACFPAF_09140 [Hymenobacter endophyticus]